MTIAATSAAMVLQDRLETATPHEVIGFLFDGALERVDQAKSRINDGRIDDAEILVGKLIGIINGLRDSLDFNASAEIASSLNSVYEYILDRLAGPEEADAMEVLEEVGLLISRLKSGWDDIAAKDME